jgi:hypothetical protein
VFEAANIRTLVSNVADAPKPEELPVRPAEQLTLSLADVRASALEANLDLQVEQVNPAIARQVVSQEEGRFEATGCCVSILGSQHRLTPKADAPSRDSRSRRNTLAACSRGPP